MNYIKPSFLNQVFQDLKTKVLRKMGSHKKLPWMYQKEIDLLTEALLSLKPKRCLEWGSGFSTVYFPYLLEKDISWTSLEHNQQWYNIIHEANKDKRVEIIHIKPDNEIFSNKDGSYEDFKSYIEYPEGKYDFIFIDGRARKDCVKKAFELINDKGLVVLHDANRLYYHEHLKLFRHQVLFDDHHTKYGGIWLGSKETPIPDLLDVEKHKKVWRRHDKLAKILNPF